MESLRAERERAVALLGRDRWWLGIVIGVVLLVIAGLLVPAGGKPAPPGRSAYDAGTTDPVAAVAAYSYRQHVAYGRVRRWTQRRGVALVHALTLALQDRTSTSLRSDDRRPAGDERRCSRAVAGRPPRDRAGQGLCTYVNIVLADSESREQLMRDLAGFVTRRGVRAAVVRNADRDVRLRSCG